MEAPTLKKDWCGFTYVDAMGQPLCGGRHFTVATEFVNGIAYVEFEDGRKVISGYTDANWKNVFPDLPLCSGSKPFDEAGIAQMRVNFGAAGVRWVKVDSTGAFLQIDGCTGEAERDALMRALAAYKAEMAAEFEGTLSFLASDKERGKCICDFDRAVYKPFGKNLPGELLVEFDGIYARWVKVDSTGAFLQIDGCTGATKRDALMRALAARNAQRAAQIAGLIAARDVDRIRMEVKIAEALSEEANK